MEIPLLAGRASLRDTETAPPVVVINEAAARSKLEQQPIGAASVHVETSARFEVVGVLRDAKCNAIRDAAVPTISGQSRSHIRATRPSGVRTAGDPVGAMGSIQEASPSRSGPAAHQRATLTG
jgi:hypothetical protein